MADNTIFDSVFKTMVHKAPQLVVPFINEAFGRDYPWETPIVPFNTEHEGPTGTTIADSVFRLQDKIYHIECQSTPDADMAVRMIEYDFAIALEQAIVSGAPYEMNFPESCVLFLRHKTTTPDELAIKVNLPDGGSFRYAAKVVKAQRFSSEDIFEKRLLILLPFYLLRYEKALGEIASDDARSAQLIAECSALRSALESDTIESGETLLYEQLVELIIKVNDYLLSAYGDLQKKVRRAMGGEVLELMRERMERVEREAREQGLAEGRIEGRIEGREEGIDSLVDQLRSQGIDDAEIERALDALRAKELLG